MTLFRVPDYLDPTWPAICARCAWQGPMGEAIPEPGCACNRCPWCDGPVVLVPQEMPYAHPDIAF